LLQLYKNKIQFIDFQVLIVKLIFIELNIKKALVVFSFNSTIL